jgi:hypothetical protein
LKVIITIIIHIIITIVVAVFCLGRKREREFGERRGALQAGVGVPAACRFSRLLCMGGHLGSRWSAGGKRRKREREQVPREGHETEEEAEGRCNQTGGARWEAALGSKQQAASSSSDTQHGVASE